MTLPYSQFIWDKISPLWYLQFPWRFLEFAALFSALLAGSLNKNAGNFVGSPSNFYKCEIFCSSKIITGSYRSNTIIRLSGEMGG